MFDVLGLGNGNALSHLAVVHVVVRGFAVRGFSRGEVEHEGVLGGSRFDVSGVS